MKKTLSLILAVLCLMSAFSVGTSAKTAYKAVYSLSCTADGKTYSPSDTVTVTPGDTVKVTMNYSNNYYLSGICAQLFYNTDVFSDDVSASYNTSGSVYNCCGKRLCLFTPWGKLASSYQQKAWPDYDADTLTQFKKNHHYCYMTMTVDSSLTDVPPRSVNEKIITYTFKVKLTAKNGTTGQILIPKETVRKKTYLNGYTMSPAYTSSDMTKDPSPYLENLSYDLSAAKLNFKVSNTPMYFEDDSVSMNYKQSKQLTVTVTSGKVKNIKWKSSDESVAKVSADGIVTATGKGDAVITAYTSDGKYSADCRVSVGYTVWQLIVIYVLLGFIWYV